MITCHHKTAKDMSFPMRKYMDLVSNFVSLQIEAFLRRQEMEARMNFETQLSILKNELTNIDIERPPIGMIYILLTHIEKLLHADVVAVAMIDEVVIFGSIGKGIDSIV